MFIKVGRDWQEQKMLIDPKRHDAQFPESDNLHKSPSTKQLTILKSKITILKL